MGHGDTPPPAAGPPPAGPYPYPPAQPQPGGVTAPGGYPVYSPGAGPSSAASPSQPHPQQASPYPPQPPLNAMEPPQKPAQGGPPPPSGYPGAGHAGPYSPAGPYPPAGPGPHGYPPPQSGAGPAPGYPVMGTPAVAAVPVGGMSVEQGGVPPGQEPCGCSAGWVLFGVGFLFWPCWVAAAFLPLCTKNRSDRLAGMASTIGMFILVVLAIIIGATSSRWRPPNSF